ncbi:retrovirus-related pol polyprotein from transposon TNT 1-94 [Tanacetum coccineum]
MSQYVLIIVMNSMSLNNNYVNMEMLKCDSCKNCLNLDVELSKSKQAYNDLLKNHSELEQHCISLEVSMQLKQEVFQNDESCVNQNAIEIQEYFEINDLKARLQDKDKTIYKLKDTIKSLRENTKEENVNHDKCDLEPLNKELENSVAKFLSENERLCNELNHVKQVFKDQFDSIKQTCVRHKEQRKEIVENVVHIPSANTIAPGMFNLDLEPLPSRLLQNREVHIDYLRNTQEQANILWEIVKQAKAKQPLDGELDLAYSNTPVLSSTGGKCSTRNYRSKPPGNKKNDRISQPSGTCNKSMFNGVHDKCLLDLVQNRNNRTKFAKKHRKQNIWKPTGLVFTEVGFKWKQIGRTFTIVGSSKIAKIVESKNANHSEPNQTWGSNATAIPSSSSLVMTDCPNCTLIREPPDFKDYGTLCEWYENVGITHQTSVARTPQQNSVVKRQNQTLVEVARTMLIFSKAPLFLLAEAINTACYTQNRSLIRHRYNKTSYDLMQDKTPDLSFFLVFGSLCYPTNDHEDLGKFDAKADIRIFVGYAPAKKVFRIYNRRTQIITKTIHATFDELTTMASEQFSSGPGLQGMTPVTYCT